MKILSDIYVFFINHPLRIPCNVNNITIHTSDSMVSHQYNSTETIYLSKHNNCCIINDCTGFVNNYYK